MLENDFLKSIPMTAVMEWGVERTWIVFEESTGSRRWYHRFCHPRRQHCWVLHYDGYQWWRYERLYSGISHRKLMIIAGVQFDQACDLSWFYRRGHDIFEVPRAFNMDRLDALGKMRSFPLEFSTCVQYVLDFSGMNSFGCYTPEQLYRRLSSRK